MQQIKNSQEPDGAFQLAKYIFSLGYESVKHPSRQMSKYEIRLIMNSFIIGVQLERLKPSNKDRINLVLEIGEEIIKLEAIKNEDDQQSITRIYDNFFFNPNLNVKIQFLIQKLMTLIKQELKIQSQQIIQKNIIPSKKKEAQIKKQEEKLNKTFIQLTNVEEEKQQFLITEQQMHLFQQQKSTKCSICDGQIEYEERWSLGLCEHSFHRQCISSYFKIMIIEKDFPLRCPVCKIDVLYDDLTLFLDESTLTQYDQYKLIETLRRNTEDTTWLSTQDNRYDFEIDLEPEFDFCPICKKRFLSSEVQYHIGQTCLEYVLSLIDKKNKKNFSSQQCPQCKFWVQKKQDSNHIICACKYESCFACGGPYSNCFCIKC